MDVGVWILLGCGAGVMVAFVWWKHRARRAFTIDRVRVELHDACIVDDRIVEAVWRAAISMMNNSRRPRALPAFRERATVSAGRREYLACVYLEADVSEVNPGDVAVAWVEFVLPADAVPRRCNIVLPRDPHSNRSYRLAVRREPRLVLRADMRSRRVPGTFPAQGGRNATMFGSRYRRST